MSEQQKLFTVRGFVDAHPWARIGGLRAWLFHRQTNGFNRCVKQVGRKILLDEAEILRWIDRQSAVNQ